jgi:hypothetical protein
LRYAPGDPATVRKDWETTGQILAGNRLSLDVGQLLQQQRGLQESPIVGVDATASFHPKIGYAGDDRRGYRAFIGSQNITPALANNNSLETLMVFNRPSTRNALSSETERSTQTEAAIAGEIMTLTDTITRMARSTQQFSYQPGGLRKQMAADGTSRGFLYVESEIYGRITSALRTAAFDPNSVANGDQVVISMGELSLILRSRGYAQDLIQAVRTLAEQKRLTIVTDNSRLSGFFDSLRDAKFGGSTQALGVDETFIRLLIDTGSIRTATTGYQHDKSISIFGGTDQKLMFLSVGSANFSADSLIPVSQLNRFQDEYFNNALNAAKRTFTDFDPESPINLDTVVAVGAGRYRDEHRPVQKRLDPDGYLQELKQKSKLEQHYNVLSAGDLLKKMDRGQTLYKTGFLAERNADVSQVEQLRQALEKLNREIGGSVIEVEGRYTLKTGPDSPASQTGLKVRVRGVDSISGSLIINLTVDRHGNVILVDQNKLIPGSVFANKSSSPISLFGRKIQPGKSTQLSGMETAVSFIATVSRELSYQSRYSLVNSLFNRMVQERPGDLHAAARDIIAESLAMVAPEVAQAVESGQGRANLRTMMSGIKSASKELGISPSSTVYQAQRVLAAGVDSPIEDYTRTLSEADFSKRQNYLRVVFDELLQHQGDLFAQHRLTDVLLLDEQNLFQDLKLKLLLRSDENRRKFFAAQSTQTYRIVSDLAAPFLAAHELGYSGLQAVARLPVYSQESKFPLDTTYDRVIAAGVLDPAEVKSGTRLGEAGEFYRAVGAVTQAKPLKITAYGGLRQLTVVDSDISIGAATAHDMEKFLKGTAGLASVSREQWSKEVQQLQTLLVSKRSAQAITEEQDTMFLLPFPKPEQIPQRLKNVGGSRPAIDISSEMADKVRSLSHSVAELKADSLVSGRLREVLPAMQFAEVKRVASQYNGDFEKVQEYFRQAEMDPNNAYHGVIGPRAMKRVALIGGVSLVGDSSWVNSGYKLDLGDPQRVTVKVSSKQIKSQTETIGILSRYLAKGSVVIGAPIEAENQRVSQLLAERTAENPSIRDTQLQTELEQFDGGRYAHYLLKRDRGELKLYLKEGLYNYDQEKGDYQRTAQFSREGLIELEEAASFAETMWGRRRQTLTVKFGAFGKRHQEGVSVITEDPHVNVSQSGLISVTTDAMAVWRAGSGSRPAGAGLVKGPFTVIEESLFKDIQQTFSKRDPGSLMPEPVRGEKVYGLFGFSHFKGFNYESGIYLLSQRSSREALQSLPGQELARSLSLLFLGDETVKTELQRNLKRSNLEFVAHAIAMVQGTDFAKVDDEGRPASTLGKVALGLTLLADGVNADKDVQTGSLSSLKQTVIKALRGDEGASKHLKRQAGKLITAAVSDPAHSIRFSQGRVGLNEGSLIVRGAGLLAHTAFISKQIFGRSTAPGASVGTLFEQDLSDIDRYYTDPGYRNMVDAVAANANLSLKPDDPRHKVKSTMELLQAHIKNDFIIQDLRDMSVSRSLVPAGSKDEVALEYQYLTGLSSAYLRAFKPIAGDGAQQVHKAFAVLSGSLTLGLQDPNAAMEYRLALPSDEPGFTSRFHLDTQRFLLGYTSLGYKMGLLNDAIRGVGTRPGTERGYLLRFINLQQIATTFAGEGQTHLEERGVTLSRTYGVPYFSDQDSPAGRLQTKRLMKQLHLSETYAKDGDRRLSPMEIVTKLVSDSYSRFVADRRVRRATGEESVSFQDFVESGQGGRAISELERHYKVISELSQGSHRLVGVPLSSDDEVIRRKVQSRLKELSDRQANAIRENLNTNLYKQFVEGALHLETELSERQEKVPWDGQVRALLSEVRTTKQIVLPKFSLESTNDGRYRVSLLDPQRYKPSLGVLMGTDILRSISFIFPQYIDEGLRHQVDVRRQLVETEELRGRLMQPGAIISEAEKRKLETFQDSLENSRLGLVHLLGTDFVRKAMGDRQTFEGAVGIAVGSFALDPDEVGLGKRFHALVEDRNFGQMLSAQFNLIEQSSLRSPEHGARMLEVTRKLINSIGLKGPELDDKSGIMSRHSLDLMFESAQQSIRERKLSATQVLDLKAATISAMTNLPQARVQDLLNSRTSELSNVLALSKGAVRRGGAPAGSAGLTNETNVYNAVDLSTIQDRVRQAGGGLIPNTERSRTMMAAPAVGRLLSMLGDYDGDAYQFLLTNTTKRAAELHGIQKDIARKTRQLTRIEAEVDRHLDIDIDDAGHLYKMSSLSEQAEILRGELETHYQQLTEGIEEVNKNSLHLDRTPSRALKDVRKWVGSYVAFPDFIINNEQKVSTGTLMAMVQQLSGTMPQIEDARSHLHKTEERLAALQKFFDPLQGGVPFSPELSGLEKDARFSQLPEDIRSQWSALTTHSRSDTLEGFLSKSRDYFAFQANVAMGVEQINKSLKKAAGTIVNPFEMEGLQATIGQAGTELIGKTYNVLIPLLDRAIMGQSISAGLQTTGAESFKQTLDTNLLAMQQREGDVRRRKEIRGLREKLMDNTSSLRGMLLENYSGTVGTLGTMQQLIRDALKEKSEKGLIGILRQADANGKPLSQLIEEAETDRDRIDLIKKVVSTRLGPDISTPPGLEGTAARLREGQVHDPGITGFGALLRLAEFAMSDDETDLHKRFVEQPGLEKEYRRARLSRRASNVADFAALQIQGLLERSQAAFISSTLSSDFKQFYVDQLRDFHAEADSNKLSGIDRQYYDLVSEYEQQRSATSDLGQLNERLVQESTLLKIQHRNKEFGVLSVDQIKGLRESFQATSRVRFGSGDITERMIGANIDTYNAYIRMLQRGQQLMPSDALYMAYYKLAEFQGLRGYDQLSAMSPTNQQRAAQLMGVGLPGLSRGEQAILTEAMLTSPGGRTPLAVLQKTSGAISQGVYGLFDQLESLGSLHEQDENSIRYAESMRRQLAGIYEHGEINFDKVQQMGVVRTTPEANQVLRNVQEKLTELSAAPLDRKTPVENLRAMEKSERHASMFGAFTAPLLLAAAGAGAKFDDRMWQFGFDTLQAVAMLSSQKDTATAQLSGHSQDAAVAFSLSRIKNSMATEGFMLGAVQGFTQETMFAGINAVSHALVDKLSGRTHETPSGKSALLTVGAEVLSTIASLSIARGATQQRTLIGEYIPDRVGDLLEEAGEQVDRTEMELRDIFSQQQEYEVLDTDDNQRIDFDISAIPTQLEQDIMGGLVVINDESTPIATEFEDTASRRAELMGTVSDSYS